MSGQAQLGQFETGRDPRGQRTVDTSGWRPGGDESRRNRCRGCGSHLDPDTARVLGPEDSPVERCPGCATQRELNDGAAAGAETDGPRGNYNVHGGGRR